MKVAYMFVVCSDCGLWLPIRVNYPADRLPKAWCFFATVIENHSCKRLVPLIIYMADLMDVPSRDARVLIQFLPSFIKNFPYTCEECGIEAFTTPDEMDLHFQKVHHIRYKCTKCGECSGTELFHKAHLSSHLSDSLLLADYLRTSCTFHPPPHCRDAPPVVGSDKRCPASGGSTSSFTPGLLHHDLVSHCEEMADMKILNSLENAKVAALSEEEASDEDEDDGSGKHRADAAYEDYDYSRLEDSAEGKEAKKFFTKRISLPISACMELLSGNLFLKRFMYCTVCNTIVTTQTGIDTHSKSKCGVEGMVSLYCPPAPVDSVIECPTCSVELCSISALRGHMAIHHGVHVEYRNGKQGGFTFESDASLQELASRYPDQRSAVSRDTDNALWLRYGVLQPKSQFDMQLKLAKKGIRVTSLERKDSPGSTLDVARRGGVHRNNIYVRHTTFPPLEPKTVADALNKDHQPSVQVAQGINQQYIKPFVLVNNMLRCKFCAHQTSTPQAMRDHLQSNHVLVCRACGNGFAHREALTRHGKMGRYASVKNISADCGVCRKRMSLANAYLHLFREHLSSIVYGTVSGQVYPEHQNLHVDEYLDNTAAKDSVVYAAGVDQPPQPPPPDRNAREVVIYKRPSASPLKITCACYLCGMEMVSLEQLSRHLDRHSESWTRCPFCQDPVPISSHEAMKAHLMQKHMEKRDGSLVSFSLHLWRMAFLDFEIVAKISALLGFKLASRDIYCCIRLLTNYLPFFSSFCCAPSR
ncbi:unnamed protein product [Nippostrongylus brasiliensis]|uniref:Zinc finger protein lin-13 (inferred by orthology to a C. elegans protein) n=1 Tax=Nippostrongylus brasiliensis TaxID=27835 RepID=A0A0N4XFI0_NIPBR|nr:unnamed protein product [Nippostrongylus brasiliensis]